MTDTEILRSPTEVLYAVSDKRKIRPENPDVKSVSASVQTMRSELRQNPAGYYTKNPSRPSRNSSRSRFYSSSIRPENFSDNFCSFNHGENVRKKTKDNYVFR
jgi:hypothetical protein